MKSYHSFAPGRSSRAAAVSVASVALTAMTLALSGCVNYLGISSNKKIAEPAQYETTQSVPNEGGAWPSLDWANQFGDPQLPKLIAEALEGNPSIAQAQARLAKAQSYIESSRSALFPQVTGSYTWTRERYSPNGLFAPPIGGKWDSENSVLASATWDLDLWGKNRAKLQAAVSQQKAAQAEVQQVRVALATSVASTYNQLAQLYALRDIAQHEIENRQTVGSITNDRVGAGLDTNVEKQTANGNIATSQSSLTDLDGQITVVRYQLGALLGKGPDRGLQIAQPTLNVGDAVTLPDNVPADLVSRRPDLVAARWQVEASMQGVKEAKAEFFPDINLAANFGFDSFGWSDLFLWSSRQIMAGPAIHLPLFDAGALRAQLKGRYADFDLDVANYNQTLINALNDVATQVSSIRSIDRQEGDAQRALDASTKAYQLAVIRYRAGLSPQLQVLNADDNRLAAEQAVTNLKMRRRGLQIGLVKALGGGFDATAIGLAAPPPDGDGAPSQAPSDATETTAASAHAAN
ncbi:efflux transporter outer membrane subunit [Paraburkholderia rhizosphaerae]|uniref:NodT family efflux transporter outer membrane factor (OMF) lipoprotein n=1 Tax=Paraburkholderia rhizosphaerae TaxID=480658 RepID=A0A4R8LI36_9BURK|nr:NodT family efflux transporter outer membrane factor (OMF) lipoprotein [Paraburkholderia rhizosphaerae]